MAPEQIPSTALQRQALCLQTLESDAVGGGAPISPWKVPRKKYRLTAAFPQ